MIDKEELALNAQLQQKKNALRKELYEMGVLKKEGVNAFDRYTYFSEAQYKKLFTGLFSKYGLELSFTETDYDMFKAEGKMPNGRTVTVRFTLTDCETGYSEQSDITGEGLDKGDKAGYKAYTGALKYYLASTFMVATGDDAEEESPTGATESRSKARSDNQRTNTPTTVPDTAIARINNKKAVAISQGTDPQAITDWYKQRFGTRRLDTLQPDELDQLEEHLNNLIVLGGNK